MDHLKMDDLKLGLIIFLALVVAGIVFIKVEPPAIGESMVYLEEPLQKNRNASFNAGDIFLYDYNSTELSVPFEFRAEGGTGCTALYAVGAAPFSCVKPDGTDDAGSNLTLEDKSLFLFRPWMLALTDTWKWTVHGCFEINKNLSCDLDVSFSVIRVDFENDKKYYVVRADYGPAEVYYWVEDERRILAREIGPGYAITLRE